MTRSAAATVHDATERYQLLAQIGSGGMGVVYEANDAQARRPVALKFARREANQKTARQQLAREAAAMSLPHDRHICSVYDLATCAGKTCMVMERLVGQTLQSRIAAGPLATLELLDIALQLVEALGAIHRVGLVHQDVKPANVFLTTAGAVKVLDFGLAVVAGGSVAGVEQGSTGRCRVMGTPNYIAPERLSSQLADPRSDLFSLGVVIYEMATGRPPFAAPTCQDVLFNVVSMDPVPVRTLAPKRPPALERLVRKLLKRNADDRYHSAAEVKRALKRIRTRVLSACVGRPEQSPSTAPWADWRIGTNGAPPPPPSSPRSPLTELSPSSPASGSTSDTDSRAASETALPQRADLGLVVGQKGLAGRDPDWLSHPEHAVSSARGHRRCAPQA